MDWRRQAVVVNGAESHKDFWRVGHGNAEWMFGTRNIPCFWLDNGVCSWMSKYSIEPEFLEF